MQRKLGLDLIEKGRVGHLGAQQQGPVSRPKNVAAEFKLQHGILAICVHHAGAELLEMRGDDGDQCVRISKLNARPRLQGKVSGSGRRKTG